MKNENFVVLLELNGCRKDDSNIQFIAEPVLKFGDDLYPTQNPLSTIDDQFVMDSGNGAEISGYKRLANLNKFTRIKLIFKEKWTLPGPFIVVASFAKAAIPKLQQNEIN